MEHQCRTASLNAPSSRLCERSRARRCRYSSQIVNGRSRSAFDRFIPNRGTGDLDSREFFFARSTSSSVSGDRSRMSSLSSSRSSSSSDLLEESMSLPDDSFLTASSSNTSSTESDRSVDSLNDSTHKGGSYDSRVALVLFDDYDKTRQQRVLNFQPRPKISDPQKSSHPFTRTDPSEKCPARQTGDRSSHLRNLLPEKIYNLPTFRQMTGCMLNTLDARHEGFLVAINDEVYVGMPFFDFVFKSDVNGAAGNPVDCVAWHADVTLFAAASNEKTRPVVKLSDPEAGFRPYYDQICLDSPVISIAWNRGGVLCGCLDGGVYHFDDRSRSTRPSLIFDGHGHSPVLSCRYDRNSDLLATGDMKGTLLVWERRQPTTPVNRFDDAHAGPIAAMSWCPWQYGLLATGNGKAEPTLKFWNLITGLKTKERRVHSQVTAVQWFDAERELISSHLSLSENIVFWKYPSLEASGDLRMHGDSVMKVALLPKTSKLVSISLDESLALWDLDVKTPRRRQPMTSGDGQVRPKSPFQLGMLR